MTNLHDTITTATDRTLLDVLTTYGYDVDATPDADDNGCYAAFQGICGALDRWVQDLTNRTANGPTPFLDADPDGIIDNIGVGVINMSTGHYTLDVFDVRHISDDPDAPAGAHAALGYACTVLRSYAAIMDGIGWPDGDVTDLELRMYDGDTNLN